MAEGCVDLKHLCAVTGAGTGCGSCRPEVKELLQHFLEAQQKQMMHEMIHATPSAHA